MRINSVLFFPAPMQNITSYVIANLLRYYIDIEVEYIPHALLWCIKFIYSPKSSLSSSSALEGKACRSTVHKVHEVSLLRLE